MKRRPPSVWRKSRNPRSWKLWIETSSLFRSVKLTSSSSDLSPILFNTQIELESLKNESDIFSRERRARVEENLARKRQQAGDLEFIWRAGMYRSYKLHIPYLTIKLLQSARGSKKSRRQSKSWRMLDMNSRSRNVRADSSSPLACGSPQFQNSNANYPRRSLGTTRYQVMGVLVRL